MENKTYTLYIMPVKGGNLWSKLAGEYYNEHKNDSDIEKFSDVLKSPKFRAYYESQKNGSSMPSTKKTKGKMSKKKVSKKGKKSRKARYDEEMIEEEVKIVLPKKKIGKKIVEVEVEVELKDESEQPTKEDRKNQVKNDYFNGGSKKKGGIGDEVAGEPVVVAGEPVVVAGEPVVVAGEPVVVAGEPM